ncbi:hypothetical protein LINGRAHAP2_LOCUS13373 [Linum grandiflorum]
MSTTVLGVCNQNMQFVYYLAGWPGSAHDSPVLRDVLARANNVSVPLERVDCFAWLIVLIQLFLNFHKSMLRKYLKWTHEEDEVLLEDTDSIKTKFYYYKNKFTAQLEIMNASGLGWDDERGFYTCEKEGHPNARGLHNIKLVRWDELCKIFEYSHADRTESMTTSDASSVLEAEIWASDSAPCPPYDTFAEDSRPIMEDLINAGFDMNAEGLHDVAEDASAEGGEETVSREPEKPKSSSSGTKRNRARATEDYLNAIRVHMGSMIGTLTTTSVQIVRVANNLCLLDDIATKRSRVIDELTTLPGISYAQHLKAHRILMKEPGDLEAFFQLPNDQMKADFILSILE